MSRSHAPRLAAYATLSAAGLLAALVLGRPELVILVAPFSLTVVYGLALARPRGIDTSTALDRERAIEGDEVTLTLALESETPLEGVECRVLLPAGLALAGAPNPFAVDVGREGVAVELAVTCERWGGYAAGSVAFRYRDRLGLVVFDQLHEEASRLRAYPRAERLRTLVSPFETQVFAGNEPARAKGEGIEFADLRRFVPGDRVRRIDWRASARRNELYVSERHPERNADVVLFLDTFAEARREAEGTLDLAVRAAASLVSGYLARNDRVGLVSFGGVLRWLVPGLGVRQLYRIVDALLDTEVTLSYVWKGIDVVPTRTLPPKALVLALTPLLDERGARALLDLRARGFDLAVVEISPLPFSRPPRGWAGDLAWRLWLLRREAIRLRYRRLGVPVVEWRAETPFQAVVEEVTAFRRAARLARA